MKHNRTLYTQLFQSLNKQRLPKIGIDSVQLAAARLGIDVSKEQITSVSQLCFNNEQTIGLDDFCQFLYITENTKLIDSKMILFCAADLDFSGSIELSELKIILQRLGFKLKPEDAEFLFQRCADNTDGSMGHEMFGELIDQLRDVFK